MNASLQVGVQVARGPLATVHRGSLAGRAVAVKRARAEVPGAAAALRREARILAAASHPAIVPVLDLIDDPEAPALVLGWADGGSLGDLLADGPLPPAELLHLLRPLADGLDALHAAGAAHLDVAPENVLLAAAGPVLVDPAPPGAGTPGFSDPAVAAGGPASARSDVYGLAACAHVALTGRLPRITGGVAVGLALPRAVLEALAAGLDPEPRRRPPSPTAFVDRLELALTGAAGEPPEREHQSSPSAAETLPVGRPVARGHRRPGPPRTWPFDRWEEEAAAADERQEALAAALGPPTKPRRRRPFLVVLVVAVAVAAIGVATVTGARLLDGRRSGAPAASSRTSAPDSTRRPPAARPPPTATPGGNP